MGTTNDGGPAFPFDEKSGDGTHWHSHSGMTLRDYFAAKALPACHAEYFAGLARNEYTCEPGWRDGVAIEAYRMADAMLAARGDQT